MAEERQTFSSGEISDIFDISKSTLFRYEEEGKIPPVDRDWRNYRQYTLEHIRELEEITGVQPELTDEKSGDEESAEKVLEEVEKSTELREETKELVKGAVKIYLLLKTLSGGRKT